jgi:hypothetical protein
MISRFSFFFYIDRVTVQFSCLLNQTQRKANHHCHVSRTNSRVKIDDNQ